MRMPFDAPARPASIAAVSLLALLLLGKLRHWLAYFIGIVVAGCAAIWYLITDPSTYGDNYARDVRLYLGICAVLIGLGAVMSWRNRRPNFRELAVAVAIGAFLVLVPSPGLLGFRIIVAAALAWIVEGAAIALAGEIWGSPKEFFGSEKAGV